MAANAKIDLGLAGRREAARATVPPAGPRESRVNILLVDDQPAKLLSYEAILGELGENLIKASSGREALKHLMTTDVAVILVDVCMPEMDGFELAQLIREHPRFRRTAIILVSAVYLSDFDRLKGYDCGAVDYVPVPIIPEVLRAKVAIFAELFRKNEELQKLNSDLEQRVADRTAALEATAARLREGEERLRLALNAGQLGAWAIDFAGGAVQCTAICRTNLGLAPDAEVTNEAFFAAVYAGDRQRVREALQQALQTGADFDVEYRCAWPDGSIHWIIARGRPVPHETGVPVRVLGVTLDITDHKRAEEERALLAESERAARLEAERAARAKDEFLAMLSHELRTPLNAIVGWVHLLRRCPHEPDTVKEGLETIERSAMAQARLIDDLLDISRVVSGKLRLERCAIDLASVVGPAIEGARLAADLKGITIAKEVDSGPTCIEGDPGRLHQVLANLLSNAVKFTPKGGHVRVSVASAASHVELSVTDSGEGIDADFLPYVFECFRQADSSRTRRHRGLGLGLTIAKHLVEMHGGSIAAASAGKNQGATFTVRLPLARRTHDDEPKFPLDSSLEETCLSGVRVLVVDDDVDGCEIMRRLLAEHEAQVETAHSADAALAKLGLCKPDIFISDIGMPGNDGYQLIRAVRLLVSPVRNIPAVAVTALARPEDRLRALETGYDRHVSKPVNPRALLTAISELVQASRATAPWRPADKPGR